jgi:hypothetical protein
VKRPLRHQLGPATQLTLAIAALGTVLAAVAWTGVGSPRLRAAHAEATTQGTIVHAWVEIANDGRAPVTVHDATWTPTIGLRPAALTVAPTGTTLDQPTGTLAERVAATAPMTPFRLEAGERRVLLVVGQVACGPTGPFTWELAPPTVTASAPIGGQRTIVLHDLAPLVGTPDPSACDRIR